MVRFFIVRKIHHLVVHGMSLLWATHSYIIGVYRMGDLSEEFSSNHCDMLKEPITQNYPSYAA